LELLRIEIKKIPNSNERSHENIMKPFRIKDELISLKLFNNSKSSRELGKIFQIELLF